MRAFKLLVALRLREVFRSRSAQFFQTGLPILLVLGVGLVFLNGHPFERKRVAALDAGPAVAAVLAAYPELKARPGVLSEQGALGLLRSREVAAVLAPAEGARAPRVIVGQRDVLLGRGLLSLLPGATLQVEEVPRWGFVHYLLPGLLMFSSLISGFFGMGYPMVRYRQSLFLKKLATTPLRRGTFIASQLAARALLSLAQSALMLAVAHLAFGFPLPLTALPWAALLLSLSILVFMGLGFLMACFIHDEAAMVDAINTSTMPFIFLSEVFFPVDELPGPLPALASALPSTQMVRLLRQVLLQGHTEASSLLPGLAVVAAWLVGSFALSLAVFRWTDAD